MKARITKIRIVKGEKYHITIRRTLFGRRESLKVFPVPLTVCAYIHEEGLLYYNHKSMCGYKELMSYYYK